MLCSAALWVSSVPPYPAMFSSRCIIRSEQFANLQEWRYRFIVIRLLMELGGSIWCEEMLLWSSDNAAQLLSPTSHSHSGGASQGKFPTDGGEILIFRRRRPHSPSFDRGRHRINLSREARFGSVSNGDGWNPDPKSWQALFPAEVIKLNASP